MTVYGQGESVVRSLGPENVLLRGARLKNTPYISCNGGNLGSQINIICPAMVAILDLKST
jgi:hypothetical protein